MHRPMRDGGVRAWLGGCRLQGGCGRRARRAASTRLGLLLLVATGGHLEQVVDDAVDEDAADGDGRTWCEGVWRDKGGGRTVLTLSRTLILALTIALILARTLTLALALTRTRTQARARRSSAPR